MDGIEIQKFEAVKSQVINLSKDGKYGEAILLIKRELRKNIYLMSNNDLNDLVSGWICGDS